MHGRRRSVEAMVELFVLLKGWIEVKWRLSEVKGRKEL
jgi:hypothetical protein